MVDDKAILEHGAAVASLVAVLQTSLMMRDVYEKKGGYEGEVEGVKQTARSAIESIEGHLSFFRELCK